MNRRRFLTITAGLAVAAAALPPGARAGELSVWRGTAIGSAATIAIAAPGAEQHLAAARAEIARLERVFSLYDAGSELARLNRDGSLAAPSLDLVECLSVAGQVHAASGGLFDPTVQPLWAAHAAAFAAGRAPREDEIAAARRLAGWDGVAFGPAAISLRPGAALTLNGIAQGFIADRVVRVLRERGLRDLLVDTGEMRAAGQRAPGRAWEAELPGGGRAGLGDRALATSAPLGTTFDQAGRVGHILDPRSGRAAASPWRTVSISAPSAVVADGLSTASCLMPDAAAIRSAAARLDGARLEEAVPA